MAIDSPAAAGAGTQSKLIAKHYKLLYLDTGKIYRYIGYLKLKSEKHFSYKLVEKKIKNLNLKLLKKKFYKLMMLQLQLHWLLEKK